MFLHHIWTFGLVFVFKCSNVVIIIWLKSRWSRSRSRWLRFRWSRSRWLRSRCSGSSWMRSDYQDLNVWDPIDWDPDRWSRSRWSRSRQLRFRWSRSRGSRWNTKELCSKFYNHRITLFFFLNSFWRLFENDRNKFSKNRIKLFSPTASDNGVYSCRASNPAGHTESGDNFLLSVPGRLPTSLIK